jgi:hypothetical protein
VATRGAIDPADERRRLWRIEVDGLAVVDLRRPGLAVQLGIAEGQLTGPRSRAQGLAATARKLGADGLVVPSAAIGDAWNLVVFPSGFDRVRVAGSRAMHPRPPA